uniref:Uncharacterized protein n=1 Tax=Compsopogon caeruleus TaxID=31354 RepID=A0A7S1THZ0_9RHOD
MRRSAGWRTSSAGCRIRCLEGGNGLFNSGGSSNGRSCGCVELRDAPFESREKVHDIQATRVGVSGGCKVLTLSSVMTGIALFLSYMADMVGGATGAQAEVSSAEVAGRVILVRLSLR